MKQRSHANIKKRSNKLTNRDAKKNAIITTLKKKQEICKKKHRRACETLQLKKAKHKNIRFWPL